VSATPAQSRFDTGSGHSRFARFSPARMAVAAFGAVVAIVTVVLCTPLATASHRAASFIDALFTATSAVCVTGLTTVSTAGYWSPFGQVAILVGIQVGGFGIMTLGALLSLITSRRLGLRSKLLTASETGTKRLGDVGLLVRAVAISSLAVELVLAAILVPRFLFLGESLGRALWNGVFFAVSTFNNAGFTPTHEGLIPFQSDWMVLVPIAMGVFIGSLGFPVILDMARHVRRPSRWTLHTKLTLTVSVCLLVGGAIMLGAMEWSNPRTLGDHGPVGRVLGALFSSVMTRSGGFSAEDVAAQSGATLLTEDALMFIGGGSASTAGGIKVTTLAVMLLAIRAEARGDRDMEAYGRRIPKSTLRVAVTVAVAAVVLVFVGTLVLALTSPGQLDVLAFEAISAFATCGLSTGLAPTLPVAGKLTLIALMLTGRLGTMTIATSVALSNRRRLIRLPAEAPIVG
jgi:Trk-type K+ transport system membrane component